MRNILHLRVDSFPVAVERLRDSSLRGRPVVICPRHSPRSVIFSTSPEARSEGIYTGMPLTAALQRCRSLTVLPPDETLYKRATRAVSDVLEQYSPLVEPGLWGRFFLDISGTRRLLGGAQDAAFTIRKAVKETVRLENAMGIASNKLVSSVAARVVSARGDLYEVPLGSEASFLAPLRVRMLPTVQSKMERELLAEFNIRRVRQLASIPVSQLVQVFGKLGRRLHNQALGIDLQPVLPPGSKPFIFEESTLSEDSNDDDLLLSYLYRMTERACFRMRQKDLAPHTVWLHLRYTDGVDVTRRMKLKHPVTIDPVLFGDLRPFFLKSNFRRQRMRYLSVTFTDLIRPPQQMTLFEAPSCYQKEESLVSALDSIRSRFGEKLIQYGRMVN